MPLVPNILERTLFLTMNQAPAPMLDMWAGPAFWSIQTALKLNVFEILASGAKTTDQIAKAIPADQKGIKVLLGTLKSLGYVDQSGDRYSNSSMTEKWLLDSGTINLSPFFLYWGALMQNFMPRLEESIRSGEDMKFYEWIESQPEVSKNFQEGMIQLARFVANDISKALSLPPSAKNLLDVGGGHGEYAIALCKQNSQLSAVIFDGKQALVTGQQAIEKAGLSDRIHTQSGNFMVDELPSSFDVALVFNIVHGLKPEQNIDLFRKIKNSLNSGGQIVILEQVHDIAPMPMANAVSYILSVAYYHLVGGQVYTKDEITDWLTQAGFGDIQRKTIMKASSVLVIGTC